MCACLLSATAGKKKLYYLLLLFLVPATVLSAWIAKNISPCVLQTETSMCPKNVATAVSTTEPATSENAHFEGIMH